MAHVRQEQIQTGAPMRRAGRPVQASVNAELRGIRALAQLTGTLVSGTVMLAMMDRITQ